jgi:hypothetical protein
MDFITDSSTISDPAFDNSSRDMIRISQKMRAFKGLP